MAKYQLTVEVHAHYVAEQSTPEDDVYVFSYTVTISNTGEVAAQVIARHWSINDATGLTERVKGLGIVGQQPLIKPGHAFEYASGTRLRTPTGTMHGKLLCMAEDGEPFEADIPLFVLDALGAPGGKDSSSKRTLH